MTTRIRNIPAVVEWTDTSSTPRSFLHLAGPDDPSVQLNLQFDEAEQTGILKIKIRVLLGVGEETAGQDVDYLYLWIKPEDVVWLLPDPEHRLQDGVSTVLRGPTTCLRLVLSKPACVVAPSGPPLPLREGLGPQMLDSLILLAKQTALAIHMERRLVPDQKQIQRLCQVFSDGSVRQHPRHTTLRDFYKGRSAVVVEDLACFAGSEVESIYLTADGPSNACDAATLPPYTNFRPPPPFLFAQPPSNKRQRVASPIMDGTELLAQQKAQTDRFCSTLQAQMEKMLASMGAQVDRMADKVVTRVDKRMIEESAKIWDKKPYEWERMIQNGIKNDIDNALATSLPNELEAFKDNVVDDCLDRLKRRLEGGMVSITLPDID